MRATKQNAPGVKQQGPIGQLSQNETHKVTDMPTIQMEKSQDSEDMDLEEDSDVDLFRSQSQSSANHDNDDYA